MENYYLIGAGGHAMVIADIVQCCGNVVSAFYDIKPLKEKLLNVPILHLKKATFNSNGLLFAAVGNNEVRKRIATENINNKFGKIVHPFAQISNYASIHDGTVVMSGVSINTMAHIGRHCIINTNASIDHECVIEDFVHISPNATLCGNVQVGEGTHIGAGAIVIPGIKIGKWATVGAGAVVIDDVPDFATIVGNPARIIKINNNE